MKFQSVLSIVLGLIIWTNSSCTKKYEGPVPVIYGHGGISLSEEREVFPRNTDQSILYALDVLNADGVEIDVQMTKDSVLVVYHEDYLDEYTNGTGCVNDLTFEEIKALDYFRKYKILELETVIKWTNERNKKIYLDIKQLNICSGNYIDFSAFNISLNKVLGSIDNLNKEYITANCRAIQLLDNISDTVILKTLESDDIPLGISYVEQGKVHKLGIKLEALNAEKVAKLKNKGIEFMIFGIKTTQDIKKAAEFVPNEIITDNIPSTRKYYY